MTPFRYRTQQAPDRRFLCWDLVYSDIAVPAVSHTLVRAGATNELACEPNHSPNAIDIDGSVLLPGLRNVVRYAGSVPIVQQ